MMKTLILYLIFGLTGMVAVFHQDNASITGQVMDSGTGKPVMLATVSLYQGEKLLTGTTTDYRGQYTFHHVAPGRYDLEVRLAGYEPQKKRDVVVTAGKVARANFTLTTVRMPQEKLDFEKPSLSRHEVLFQGHVPTEDENELSRISAGAPNYIDTYTGSYAGGGTGDDMMQDGLSQEAYELIRDNAFLRVQDNPLSTFSIDVDRASYSNIRRYLRMGLMPPKDAVRIEEMVNYFDYNYPQPEGQPFSIVTEMHPCPWAPEHQLLHIGLQGKKMQSEIIPASNLVFLIDVSGSMQAENKLPLVIKSLRLLTEQLREQDRIAIAVYAGAAGLVLPGTSGANKEVIIQALEKLEAGGSTAGAAGLTLAYQTARANFIKNGNNRVILATDGDFNVGVSNNADLVRMIEKERESGIFLTVLGFGMGNYKDDRMQQLADHGNGNHAYIDNLNEARKLFVNEFSGTLFTIAKDVKIQIEFNPAQVQSYRLIGYENRILAAQDFNDDKKDAGEIGAGHTVTALYEIIPTGVTDRYSGNVDKLKYQQTGVPASPSHTGEWCTIKFRYKAPDGDKSQLIEQALTSEHLTAGMPSDNFSWSAAVAAFGMILRDSEYKGESSMDLVRRLANQSLGKDPYGYRAEFLSLLDHVDALALRE